jgi:hypothetical protein
VNEKLEALIKHHLEAVGLRYHPPGQRTIQTEQERAIEEIARWFKPRDSARDCAPRRSGPLAGSR